MRSDDLLYPKQVHRPAAPPPPDRRTVDRIQRWPRGKVLRRSLIRGLRGTGGAGANAGFSAWQEAGGGTPIPIRATKKAAHSDGVGGFFRDGRSGLAARRRPTLPQLGLQYHGRWGV